MLYLRDDFQAAWRGRDPFEQVNLLEGCVYRNVKARRTLQFEHQGKSFFVKIHRGIGWREILKDLTQWRKPVLGAENEWLAINRLHELGVPTMTAVGYGRRGSNPARIESFIITEDLVNTVSLEDLGARWPVQRPPFRFKRALIDSIAGISRTLHNNGICHRDYYLCHFLLRLDPAGQVDTDAEPVLHLIDLHRALIDRNLPRRWIIKDIAGLYFSALQIGLTRTDLLRFVRSYSGRPLREALRQDAGFWQAVLLRTQKMDRRLNAVPTLGRTVP